MKLSKIKNKTAFKRMIAFITSLTMLASSMCFPEISDDIKSIFNITTANAEVDTVTNIDKSSLKDLYLFSKDYHDHPENYPRVNLTIAFQAGTGNNEITSTKIIDGETLTWYPLGTKNHPFDGRLVIDTNAGVTQSIVANAPIFGYITDTVEIVNVNKDPSGNYTFQDISLLRNEENDEAPLFAEHIVHDADGLSLATWNINIDASKSYGCLIGDVGEDSTGTSANINLRLDNSAIVSTSQNAGLICGKIYDNSSATVNFSTSGSMSSVDVTSTGNSAGAFVGEMCPGSEINLITNGAYDISSASRTIIGKTYAGGLVGNNNQGTVKILTLQTDENDDPVIDENDEYVYDENSYEALGTITATDGSAGGVFGYFKVRSDDNRFSPDYYTSETGCTLSGKTAGGLVGVLDGNGVNISYSGSVTEVNNAQVVNKVSVVTTLSGNHTTFGGIVGSYSNDNLSRSFTAEHTTVSVSGGSATNYGGVIGKLEGSKALYVHANDFTLASTSSVDSCTYFGGIVGSAGNQGSMLNIGDITISTNNVGYKGGGVVGQLSAGVLRLSGTTNLSNAPASSGGQIVGERKEALVYALGSGEDAEGTSYGEGWRLIRSTTDATVDDIGTWGEVVRIANIEGVEAREAVEADPEAVPPIEASEAVEGIPYIVSYDPSTHKVNITSAVTDMRTVRDVVSTALNMQLNNGADKGALCFDDKTDTTTSSRRSRLLDNENLTVWGTISLASTGITGFMRDGSTKKDNDSSEIKAFTGKLSKGTPEDGEEDKDAIIQLAIGERYGVISTGESSYDDVTDSNSTGRGAIFRHRFNGLFARTGDTAAMEDITVDGYMNIRASADDMNIGGAIAYLENAATLTDVKAIETINYTHLGSASNHYVGGLVGMTNCAAGKTVTIEGTDSENKVSIAPVIKIDGTITNDDLEAKQAIGGVIGYISSKSASTTNIENITLSANIDATINDSSVACPSVAGLIADVAWNDTDGTNDEDRDTRTLSLTNIDVSGLTVKNNASSSSGGILGYRWFCTNVTLDNVNLDSNIELNTSAPYIGGLVYKATGHWQVNEDGIIINALDLKNGDSTASPTSLGIIVHDGYYHYTKDTTIIDSGIFLEMMSNNSYTLADSGLTIPTMSSNYDELVYALSTNAASLLTNNTAGVISYATDGAYSMDGAGTRNSYNNIYNRTIVNNRSRYYYNADSESYANKDSDNQDSYKLLYWSLNRYASKNIKHCFGNPFSGDVLSGNFDLKSISYYPIDIEEDVTIGSSNTTIVFYNSDIEATETASNTKRSTRETVTVNSVTSGKSQHYLMHSGLFKDVKAKITTTGNITMYGSVGVNSLYSGALINGTLTGTLDTASNKIIQLGYYDIDEYEGRPLVISNNNRYLLINKIGNKAVLNLNGLYIGDRSHTIYDTSNNNTYASSLIGDVQGIGINLKFNNILIDSRNREGVSIKTPAAYSTTKSIFKNATLLNKFDVDPTSVAIYNFSQTEDWKTATNSTTRYSKVTYGKELTDTIEYMDESTNLSEENRYYEDGERGNYIDPNTYPGAYSVETAPANSPYSFSANFLPYVRYYNESVSGAPTATNTLREIKVNVIPSDLTNGCGTYDHPYKITAAKQLKAVADMLDAKEGYQPIPNINLPVDKTDTSHWCCTSTNAQNVNTNSCVLFTPSSDGYISSGSTDTWTNDDVRKYLASAYYQIGQDIVLGTNFTGLGANDSTYAFKGIIVGLNDQVTITNKSTAPFIKVSNGSVVRNLKITVNINKDSAVGTKGSTSTVFGYANSSSFYGGVIGEIMGGDNIIDNVSVTYSNSAGTGFLKIADSYLMCVGGYVGVIVNGGLIFRNMTSSSFVSKNTFKPNKSTTNEATVSWISNTETSHLYVNPYIGRVINGYAINETTKYSGDSAPVKDKDGNNVYNYYASDGSLLTDVTDSENDTRIAKTVQQFTYDSTVSNIYTLDNGTKNYQIADVKVNVDDDHKLYYDSFSGKNRVNIPDGQSLFVLSLITQSGAGTATTANGNYVYGVAYDCENSSNRYHATSAAQKVATHLAKYDKVGEANSKFADKSDTTSDYYLSRSDTNNSAAAVPYIIHHYTKADGSIYPARMMIGNTGFMKLSTEGSNYNLPEGFRGIGSIATAKTGGSANASTDNEYQMHIYGLDGNGATVNEQIVFNAYYNGQDNYAKNVYNADNVNMGLGLFNILVQKANADGTTFNLSEGYYIGDFKLTGKITVNEYDSSGTNVGGGFDTADSTSSKSNKRTRYSVGGLAGGTLASSASENPLKYINLYNLDLNNLKVTGTSFVGGYIGRNNITEYDADQGKGKTMYFLNGCDTTATEIKGSKGCCGGVIGGSISGYPSVKVNTALLKSGDTHSVGTDGYYSSTMELSIENESAYCQSGIGGIIGTLRNGYEVTLWINNVTVKGAGTSKAFSNNTTSVYNTLTPGAGGLFGCVRKADSVIITNCTVEDLNINAPLAGGLFGNIDFYDSMYKYGTSPVIKIANCTVTSSSASTYSIVGIKGAGGITGQFTSSKAYDKTVTGYDGNDYKYDVNTCEISNYTISQTGSSDVDCGAGGLFGFARATCDTASTPSWAKMRTVANTSVHDCIIKANGTYESHGMGAIIGCVPTKGTTNNNNYAGYNNGDSTTISIDDTGTKRKTQGVCGNVGAYNISCYNNTFNYNGTGTSAKCGNFVGQSHGQTFKIVGFMRKNNTKGADALTVDYGGDVSGDSYIIDADYTNISTTNNHGSAMAFGFTNGTNVGPGASSDIQKNYFPYVTVSPKIAAGNANFLTGDGMNLTSIDDKSYPLAKLITTESDGTTSNNRVAYTNVSSSDINLVKTLISRGEDSTTDYNIKLTTYDKEIGLPNDYKANGGQDFPIIAVNGDDNFNNYINAYIRTLTNTTDDYSVSNASKYVVDIYPCQCINGVYQKVEGTQGFKLNSSNQFVMEDSAADSIADNNQFSMIDIRFLDPTDSSKTAYHLYIPVLTKKLLKFNFDSSALQGTEYEPSDYISKFPTGEATSSKLATGFDSWQTIYVQFSYPVSEVNKFLETGKGLNWNTSKSLYFNYTAKPSLAVNTEYVLLDNNYNVDKEYYKQKDSNDTTISDGMATDVIRFDDFVVHDSGSVSITDENVRYSQDNNGAYVICEEDDANVIASAFDYNGNNKLFFKLRTSETENRYSLTKGFIPQKLMDIADGKISYTLDNTDGAYAIFTPSSESDPSIVAYAYNGTNKVYFKKHTDEENRYTLTISEDLKETYYISMLAYEEDNPRANNDPSATLNDAYAFEVTCPVTFNSNVITCQKNTTHNTNIYLGNFLKQTMTMSNVTAKQPMSTSSNVIRATMTSEISFDGDNADYFHRRLAGETIYQGFYLHLNRYNYAGTIETDSTIKGQPTYKYTRSIEGSAIGGETTKLADDGAPYLEFGTMEIDIPAYSSGWKSTQSVAVTIDYGTNESNIIKEFPPNSGARDDGRGIRFEGKVRLDFNKNRVNYSNMIENEKRTERYYIDRSSPGGALTLTAIDQKGNDGYDTYGEQSHNKSPLGVNGNYIRTGKEYDPDFGDYEYIEAGMDYDVSNLTVEDIFDDTHYLNIKIELEQKVNDDTEGSTGFTYVPVNIDDTGGTNTGYLEDFTFFDRTGEGELVLTHSNDGGDNGYYYYTYSMPLDPETVSINNWPIKYTDTGAQKHFVANMGFYVKTNEALEDVSGYLYSNYKLKVTVTINGTSGILYSNTDYIVYTNARVNAQYVKQKVASP